MEHVSISAPLPAETADRAGPADVLRRAGEGLIPLTMVAFLLYLTTAALGYTTCRTASGQGVTASGSAKPASCTRPVRGRPATWPFQPKS